MRDYFGGRVCPILAFLGLGGVLIVPSQAQVEYESSTKQVPIECSKEQASGFATAKDVDAVIKHFKEKVPTVTQDSLRVWKNFKAGKSDPNYLYKYWARDVVLWLREERKLVFDSQSKVMEVFRIMKEKDLISNDAVVLLSSSVWSLLVYREGVPDLQNKLEEAHKSAPKTRLGKPKETNV
jgi:hypothetical protein